MNKINPSPNEEDHISQLSDERMDTTSESFRSENTPESIFSSDFDDRDSSDDNHVLRLQNPEPSDVLRLSAPEENHNFQPKKHNKESSNSLTNDLLNSSIRPHDLGITPPKSSTLTSTTNHPLMSLARSEENYRYEIPDIHVKSDEEKDLSHSSIEDDRPANETNRLYSSLSNTSKNNLYISHNYARGESKCLDFENTSVDHITSKRDLEKSLRESRVDDTSLMMQTCCDDHMFDMNLDMSEKEKYASSDHNKYFHSTPIRIVTEGTQCAGEYNARDPEAQCGTPLSPVEDRSQYQAYIDPYTCRVSLTNGNRNSSAPTKRIIQVPLNDTSSLDSYLSMESEEEPELFELAKGESVAPAESEDEESKRSTATTSGCSSSIPEYTLEEELRDERCWLQVKQGDQIRNCDMKVIEPFKRVISHGGYDRNGVAIIVFSACHLPDNSRPDYRYVMQNLFLYVIWTLERLVTDEYIVVYLHSSVRKRTLPSWRWLHECYKLIERRLRKSMKKMFLVHPNMWLKWFVKITKPFVNVKFFSKLSYVTTLDELMRLVPVEPNAIPEAVKQYDVMQINKK